MKLGKLQRVKTLYARHCEHSIFPATLGPFLLLLLYLLICKMEILMPASAGLF